MFEINLNMYHAVALAAVLYYLGNVMCSRISFFSKYCIPAPLVGGICFSLVNTLLYAADVVNITFDSTLQTLFQNLFFTTVGFSVSLPQLKKGGKAVAWMLFLGIIITLIQNLIGVGICSTLGADPRIGLCAGSIALVGGPGTAASYGNLMDGMGITGASVAGLAVATFGLVSGSVMGGPTARRCIEKYHLEGTVSKHVSLNADEPAEDIIASTGGTFVKAFMLIMFALGIGDYLGTVLTKVTGLTFPGYIGAMLAAAVVRNVVDALFDRFPMEEVDTVGNMSLNLFLAMALARLQLWLLVDLALPMIVTLALQVMVMFVFSYFVVFKVMGKDYDAAVMTSGFIGFAMGATSNAMANMQAVTKKYGPSPISFFAIPMVGSLFIDFFNAMILTAMLGILS